MRILGIDTSGFCISIGVVDEEKILFDFYLHHSENEKLIDIINKYINYKIDGISVGLGPGSYTGLRIGLSTAKGLAYAYNIPIAGIPTLDAFAYPYINCKVVPIIDTKMGKVYTATYENGERITDYALIDIENLLDKIKDECLILGSGVKLLKEKMFPNVIYPNVEIPKGSSIAALGLKKIKEGNIDDIDLLEPIYLHK